MANCSWECVNHGSRDEYVEVFLSRFGYTSCVTCSSYADRIDSMVVMSSKLCVTGASCLFYDLFLWELCSSTNQHISWIGSRRIVEFCYNCKYQREPRKEPLRSSSGSSTQGKLHCSKVWHLFKKPFRVRIRPSAKHQPQTAQFIKLGLTVEPLGGGERLGDQEL